MRLNLSQSRTAEWRSLVARWAHNPEVAGSNPASASRQNPFSIQGTLYCLTPCPKCAIIET